MPGVKVGDTFNGRGEMAILGLHKAILQGIDFKYVHTAIITDVCIWARRSSRIASKQRSSTESRAQLMLRADRLIG